jgi:hypothetical protein
MDQKASDAKNPGWKMPKAQEDVVTVGRGNFIGPARNSALGCLWLPYHSSW